MIYLDTHVIVWLYSGEVDRIPAKARHEMERNNLLASPVCALEVQYLFELGRIRASSRQILTDLEARIGLEICGLAFDRVIAHALEESWTRDPFDRIIVGQARVQNAGLVTKDDEIHRHYRGTVWE